jgi:alpha-glucosidase
MRPVFMADPADLSLRREEAAFMLGSDLLVVPAWAQKPNLPKGVWREISLVPEDRSDPEQAKVLMRAGSIVPLGCVVQSTEENSFSPLTLLVCPDEKGQATGKLYEDDGDGFGYRNGNFLLTTYRAECHGGLVDVVISATEGGRPRSKRAVLVEVVDGQGQLLAARVVGL